MSLLARVLNYHSERSSRPGLTPLSLNTSLTKRLSRSLSRSLRRFALHINLESPPVVLYGQPHESTGSIISGVLTLEILAPKEKEGLEPMSSRSSDSPLAPTSSAVSLGLPEVEMDSVVLLLVQTMHYSKPFVAPLTQIGSCDKCITRTNTLARWDALLETVPFNVGSHAYPFSHLIPGLLAATTKLGGPLSHSYIKYDLIAVATSGSQETSLVVPVNILRSILRGPDRNSQRVFPPTEVTASAVLPNVMYPKSTFPIELRMYSVVNLKQDRRWRMRKLSWKLEEHTHIRAYACPTHVSKLKSLEDTHNKRQLYKNLKLGQTSGHGGDGPSRNNGLHHLTVQTLMYYGPPPTTSGATRAEQIFAASTSSPASPAAIVGNQDIIEQEDVPTNRPAEEALHFDEDFGASATSNGQTSAQSSGAATSNEARPTANGDPNLRPRTSSLGANNNNHNNNHNNNSHTASPRQNPEGAVGNGLYLDELRVVAHGDVKSGWKSDFSGKGRIELVADIMALDCSTGLRPHVAAKSSTDAQHDDVPGMLNEATISCDIEDPELGVYVSHVLVVEIIVAEEVVQAPKGLHGEGLTPVTSVGSVSSASGISVGVPTGSARVLRMQFKINITERSGLGIAWDDEVPPTYDDVSALSPPTYERLASATPLSSVFNLSSPLRPTPAVLYGLGDTPFMGGFGLRQNQSIDQVTDMDDSIQELRL